jgi:hypothetical protein
MKNKKKTSKRDAKKNIKVSDLKPKKDTKGGLVYSKVQFPV